MKFEWKMIHVKLGTNIWMEFIVSKEMIDHIDGYMVRAIQDHIEWKAEIRRGN